MSRAAARLHAWLPLPAWSVLGAVGTAVLGVSVWNFVRELRTIGASYAPIVAGATGIALASGVVFASYQLRESDKDPVEAWTVVVDAFGGGLLMTLGFGLTVLLRDVEGRVVPEPAFPFVVMASLGLIGGAVVGRQRVVTGRAAESAEETRDAMAFTNSLLRHDVRNGLQIIDGHAEMLTDHDDEQVRESASVIGGQTESLDRLITEVQSVTDVLTGEFDQGTVDLSPVLGDVIETAREGTRGVEFESEIPAELPVQGGEALYSVFGNIVDNAVTHASADPVHIRVTGERVGDRIRVRVADNGQGVPESERDRVFEKGVSTDGSGHGLYVADVIVDRLGGDVSVEDSDLGGAAFVVTLPAGRTRQTGGDDNPFLDR